MKIGLVGPQTQVQHIESLFNKMDVKYKNLNTILEKNNFIKKYIEYIESVKDVDVIYSIGIAFRINPRIILPKLLGKKVVNHWIGSDILAARNNHLSKFNQRFIDKNLSCSPLISKELEEMGIKSNIIPIIPSGMKYEVSNMPVHHSVLVYLPEGNEKFYGIEYVILLANKYPDIKFNIVANSNSELIKLDNVFFLGKLSLDKMEKLYDEISILLRLPEHDGLSLMLIEALTKGKEVIYRYDFPHTHTVEDNLQLIKVFDKIVSNPPQINYSANQYIIDNFSDEMIFSSLKNIIEAIK